MKTKMAQKHKNLMEAGLLNPNPDRVFDPLFQLHPEFFDALDALQVRYEMLRSHEIDGESVVEICKRYGISRQTFYNLHEKFLREGSAALLSKKPGPRAPSKLTKNVLEFVEQQVKRGSGVGTIELLSRIEDKFAVSLHRRTIEKLLREIRSKKNS